MHLVNLPKLTPPCYSLAVCDFGQEMLSVSLSLLIHQMEILLYYLIIDFEGSKRSWKKTHLAYILDVSYQTLLLP